MKVYWWQVGLHFEPESEEDFLALKVLAKSLKIVDINDEVVTGPISGDLGNKQPISLVDELH